MCSPLSVKIPLTTNHIRHWLKGMSISNMKFEKDEDQRIIVQTDGCCLNNHVLNSPNRSAGIGIYWGFPNHPLNVKSRIIDGQLTSNRSEIIAVHMAILIAKELRLKSISVWTDSLHVILAHDKWLLNWATRSWTNSHGNHVKNIDLWKPFLKDVLNNPVHLKHTASSAAHEFANEGARFQVV